MTTLQTTNPTDVLPRHALFCCMSVCVSVCGSCAGKSARSFSLSRATLCSLAVDALKGLGHLAERTVNADDTTDAPTATGADQSVLQCCPRLNYVSLPFRKLCSKYRGQKFIVQVSWESTVPGQKESKCCRRVLFCIALICAACGPPS